MNRITDNKYCTIKRLEVSIENVYNYIKKKKKREKNEEKI